MGTVEIALDLFPSNVTVASTTYSNVRAVLADGFLKVFILTPSGVSTLYDKPVTAPAEGTPHTGVTLTTDDGLIWIEQSGGCGCGSQLKIADLFPGFRKVMVPLRR